MQNNFGYGEELRLVQCEKAGLLHAMSGSIGGLRALVLHTNALIWLETQVHLQMHKG